MLIDLHVHAGRHGLSLDDVVARAMHLGLDGVAVLSDDALPDVALLAGHERVRLFAGAEVATDRGHYLVFLPEPGKLPPLAELFGPEPETRWPVRDVIARAVALGGAVVAARPYDTTVDHPGGDILYTLAGLSAVEVVSPLFPKAISYPAVEAAECLGLPCVGGSGARGSTEDVGRAATLFTHDLKDETELIAALRAGSCWPVEFGDVPHAIAHSGGSTQRDHGAPQPRREGDSRRRHR